MADKPRDRFTDFLTRLVRVPKKEIDEKEEKYQQSRKTDEPAKPGQIIPTRSQKQL